MKLIQFEQEIVICDLGDKINIIIKFFKSNQFNYTWTADHLDESVHEALQGYQQFRAKDFYFICNK